MEAYLEVKTANSESTANAQSVANVLAAVLADETILYIKTKNAYWNMEGADFHEKHIFFEKQFIQIDVLIDGVAEQIRTIGHYAPATLKSYLSLARLSEKSNEENDSQGYITELLHDHESIIANLRVHITAFAEEFEDAGSSDFITGLMRSHEKMAWLLRSHLKKQTKQ